MCFSSLTVLCALISISYGSSDYRRSSQVIEIPQGKLVGQVLRSRDGKDFSQFLGIPYGKFGQRFQVSGYADAWDGTRNASEFGPLCMQLDWMTGRSTGAEDCLSLNIYSPSVSKNGGLAVMVFFHGGGWGIGTPTIYGPLFLMDGDVVLVTVNYRLGPFGFLNTGTPEAGGNMGLKDKVLALHWIQENIEHFGGDKARVCIFGVSAGAASVSHLILSPLAKGLFSSAISESGTALCPYSLSSSEPNAKKLGHFLDCPTSSMPRLTKCLIEADGAEILDRMGTLGYTDFLKDRGLPKWGPSIETATSAESKSEAFLTQAPFETLKAGIFNRVPWMLGVNSHEGLSVSGIPIFSDTVLTDLVNREFGRVMPYMHMYDTSADDPCTVTAAARDFYFGGRTNLTLENAKDNLTNLHSDRWFFHCTQETALLYANFAPTYLYYLTREGQNGPPTHGDELQYLMSGPGYAFPPIEPTPAFLTFSRSMVKVWTSFAKTGKPDTRNFLGLDAVPEWEPLDPVADFPHPKYFHLDNVPKFQQQASEVRERIEFWQRARLNEPFSNKKLPESNTRKTEL